LSLGWAAVAATAAPRTAVDVTPVDWSIGNFAISIAKRDIVLLWGFEDTVKVGVFSVIQNGWFLNPVPDLLSNYLEGILEE